MKVSRVLALIVGFVLIAAVGFAGGATYSGYPIVKLLVNGKVVEADVPALVMDGRTLVPARAVAEALGAGVIWNEETQTVSIASRPDARGQYCSVTNGNFSRGATLTLDGWKQYIELCGSKPEEVKLSTPDARQQFCAYWSQVVEKGNQLTLDAWRLYTQHCS